MPLHFRILLADDHPSFRHMLRVFLELNPNWEVCGEAADGLEAVLRTTELHPDIVLMDLNMPNLNGQALRKTLGQQPIHMKNRELTANEEELEYDDRQLQFGRSVI